MEEEINKMNQIYNQRLRGYHLKDILHKSTYFFGFFGVKMVLLFLFIMNASHHLHAMDFPPDVSGTVYFDYFKERLPPGSRGIYNILTPNNEIKYIGSSCDIDKRLSDHYKKGILAPGDVVWGVIFNDKTRQKKILDYERTLIKKFAPPLNKHTGAPGRSWRSEQLLKLQSFSQYNWDLLHPEGQTIISNILKGQKVCEHKKIERSLLSVMRLFR